MLTILLSQKNNTSKHRQDKVAHRKALTVINRKGCISCGAPEEIRTPDLQVRRPKHFNLPGLHTDSRLQHKNLTN